MKTIWSKLTYLGLGLLSLLGIQTASATPIPSTPPPVAEIKPNTPLYLQLGIDRLAGENTGHTLVQHWAHWSHSAHQSHYAHYSHRAHYSHYNYYR